MPAKACPKCGRTKTYSAKFGTCTACADEAAMPKVRAPRRKTTADKVLANPRSSVKAKTIAKRVASRQKAAAR